MTNGALAKAIQGDIAADERTLEKYSGDYSIFRVKPQAAVFPKDAEDLKRLVKFAVKAKRSGDAVSLTARSAGTDMSGGPLNDSVIVDFTRYFNHIRKITADEAVVEPGVLYRDLEAELTKRGSFYPPYPASKDICAVGGMVANNSGGEKTLAYGKTADYVRELKVVLSDGEEHTIRPLAGKVLQAKLKEKGFEGLLYRRVKKLLEGHCDAIQKAKPAMSKNSAGYALWDAWDGRTLDLTKIIVGSQGTLGFVTEAKLRLVNAKQHRRLVVIFAKSLDPVPRLVEALLPMKPESMESYDDRTLGLALRFLPQLVRLMKGNMFKLWWQFLPEFGMVLRGGLPKMVLLVSLASDDEGELQMRLERVRQAAARFPVQTRVTKNKAEAEKYWAIRRQSFNLLHGYVKDKDAAAFVDDIIVRPEYMPEFLPKVNAVLDRHKDKFTYTIAGHPGDGNFHIIPLVDLKDPETRRIIPIVTEEIYKLVVQYHGSITAEHNDGLIRTPYLKLMYGEEIVRLFGEVKKIFDPLNVFNPRKKAGGDAAYSFGHLKS